MAKITTLPWDPAEYLETDEDVAAYLEAASEDGDPDLMVAVRKVIDRISDASTVAMKWAGPNGPIGAYICAESKKTLDSYRSQPNNLREDANQEEDITRGGYANRQLFELVQNSADALAGSHGAYIWIRLTPTHLYCADNGQPIDENGVRGLLFSHLSSKRGTSEIGRFGLGFKSVLGVTDTPEFFSTSGSFRFDRERAVELLKPIAPDIEHYPILRLAEPIDPWPDIEADPDLREMGCWATNIVRLPLKPGAHQSLNDQIREFPAEFMLFVEHVGRLVLQTDVRDSARIVAVTFEDDLRVLDDDGNKTLWLLERRLHKLSAIAKRDSRSLDDADEVPIWWAAPVNRLNDPGRFWAFFPTMTHSLLAGILNAPWKTNEDRQNLLPGVYNNELIDAAVNMAADVLPKLTTAEDPARHLDALPRRHESGDNEHSIRLRGGLIEALRARAFVPDQEGILQTCGEIAFPPSALTSTDQAIDALESWTAYRDRPTGWVHGSALTRNRMARLEQLCGMSTILLSTATVSEWLEALVENAKRRDVLPDSLRSNTHRLSAEEIHSWEERLENLPFEASIAAIQTAALIPQKIRDFNKLGEIILTADNHWVAPNPEDVYLANWEDSIESENLVHPRLEADSETLNALKALGIRSASPETAFRDLASTLVSQTVTTRPETEWTEFWRLSHAISDFTAADIIRKQRRWQDRLCVRTMAGAWTSLFSTLLPGRIVPTDGERDRNVTIDTQFHGENLSLLKHLGVRDGPQDRLPLSQSYQHEFLWRCRQEFIQQELPREPRTYMLNFERAITSGPLEILEKLSDEGKALYTWDLLTLNSTYEPWEMRHNTQVFYGVMRFESPAVEVLRRHGRIRTSDGILKLSDGIGNPPKAPAVLHRLLSHPQAALIRRVFGVSTEIDIPVEPIGEDDPIPLMDVWPGLEPYVPIEHEVFELIRCDELQPLDALQSENQRDCIIRNNSIYVIRKGNERDELRPVARELGLRLGSDEVEQILRGMTQTDVMAYRDAIRSCPTDAHRLLAAVGEKGLRLKLPQGLTEILESEQTSSLTGVQVAEAAIATFHTGALREYRNMIGHLDPPKRWAGTHRAVEFVRSLGFGEEWAGERTARRDPYINVEGPYSLPELHDYQRSIVRNVRSLIRSNGAVAARRGMISMPTGSGKTRVAVQAIVEAIREDGFHGGILWVADRDELCEQAVEAWRQVWSSEGIQASQLRISRMWEGQPPPLPILDLHVIVATIQTLSTKIASHPESYEFLADFKLVVFDEAHRSVAPSFTSVMRELRLTRWRRSHEPILIGLTATPYRGYDEAESQRLVNRYSNNRLDVGAFGSDCPDDVIKELQDMRILAQAEHATIEGGHFYLSEDELRQSRDLPWLPSSVENRIARDPNRTRRIIEAYEDHIDPDWPVLIFATSVEHAQTLSALLISMGVKARAVSGSTDKAIRRRVVEEFRREEIKVLVNYRVFQEGFDAPRTRAIIVARPVYSPNLYFQMIGRGLRGTKNGGNDRCLIVNVKDNIDNFERKLAYSDLDWLWDVKTPY